MRSVRDATLATPRSPLPMDPRHRMGRPRQVVPGPIPTRSHAARASATSAAGVTAHAAPLDANHEPTALRFLHRYHSKSRQPQNPRTIASRSHPSSLAGSTSRENTIQFRIANVGSRFVVQATEQTARPNSGPHRRLGIGVPVLSSGATGNQFARSNTGAYKDFGASRINELSQTRSSSAFSWVNCLGPSAALHSRSMSRRISWIFA
jgi:hypothetical protein